MQEGSGPALTPLAGDSGYLGQCPPEAEGFMYTNVTIFCIAEQLTEMQCCVVVVFLKL